MSSEPPQRILEIFSSAPLLGSFGPFRLDVSNARLLRNDAPVALTPKAFEALALLIASPGQLVTREQFLEALWPDTIVEDGNLTSTIWMVRRALGDHEDWIQTVPKRGYRFVGPTDAPPPSPAPEAGTTVPTPVAPWRWRAAWLMMLTFIGVVVAAWTLIDRREAAGETRRVEALAVLPFRSLSADAEQAYFAEGVTDAVITDLASIAALRVVSHQSVRRYRASEQPLSDIARELGVDAIVQGAVGRTGRHIRLTAQLIDARTDEHLWTATYERNLDDVLTLQGELAAEVAGAIRVRVSSPERTALATRRAVDPDAYDEYLRGRYLFAQRSERSLNRSTEAFLRATDRDPTFAPAYAGLAMAYSVLGFYGYLPPADASSALRATANRALELDPGLVDAEVALASVMLNHDWDWAATERAYDRIFARSPNHAQARLWYGLMLGIIGRPEDALVERSRALALEPLSLRFNTSVADTLTSMHRYDEAIARYRRTLELEPGFASAQLGLGMALLRSGHADEAVRVLGEADRTASDMRSKAALGQAYGIVGRTTDARAILSTLAERAAQRYLSPVYLAFVEAGLGERDAAFADLERAYADRSPMLISASIEPLFDPLRDDPRFADLLRRMALPVQ